MSSLPTDPEIALAAGKRLPEGLVAEIIAKTDGVPLFVEELTKTVLEAVLLRETTDGYIADGPLPRLAIPATLQDSLMARLDRLAPVKEVAQVGAVIGREFSREVLTAVTGLSDEQLADAMARLVDAGLKVLAGDGATVDTTTANGRLILGIFAALAEFERELIRERTRAGMRAAQRRGRHVGRPRRLTPDQLDRARALIASGKGKGMVPALLGVHVATLSRALQAGP